MSVKIKLTLIYSAVLVITLATFGWISWALLSSGLRDNLFESLIVDFNRVKSSIIVSSSDELPDLLDELEVQVPGSLFIYNVETETLLGNPSLLDDVRLSLSGFTTLGTGFQFKEGLNGQQLCIGPYDESALGKLLVVTRDSGYIGSTLNQYKNVLYASIPFALVIAGVSGYFLANRSLRQVKVITATAEGIDPERLEDRIPVRHNDEMGRLSKTLNSLFDRINGFIERQNRFTADASHDLQSPLSNMKSEVDLALKKARPAEEYRRSLEIVSGNLGKMRLIIADLLTLAGLDAGPRPQLSGTIDLSGAMETTAEGWEPTIAAKSIRLNRRIQPGVSFYGEPEQFNRMFDNLLSNAVKYTPPGGEVALLLEEAAGHIVITVKDSGIGMAPEHLPHLSERFYRIDRKVEGTGLGLSIVWATAQIYGGRVEVESEVGRGTTFRVFLPIRPKSKQTPEN